jgi:hypothetical protein
MKLIRMIRDNDRVTAYLRGEGGELICKYYPKTMSSDEIMADIAGNPVVQTAAPEKTPEDEKKPTVPEPPPAPRQRITREQMIAELAKAKVKVNVNDPAALKAAYRTNILQKGE